MIPYEYHQLARLIHQERIQAAQAPRPEWAYEAASLARPRLLSDSAGELRAWVGRALRRLAARVEPGTAAAWPAASSREPAGTQ